MLVLTRRMGEEIVIDGDIIVKVVAVKGSVVRLGIMAPPAVHVLRREIHDRHDEFTQECTEGQVQGYVALCGTVR